MTVLKARIGGVWTPVGVSTTDRWNTAWGVVAMGSLLNLSTLPANTETQITDNLPFTSVVGRRYRFVFRVRAVNGSVASGMNLYLRDGTSKFWPQSTIPYIPLSGAGYNTVACDWVLEGDGAARSHNVSCNPGAAVANVYPYDGPAWFYIEDVGPVVGANPIPNPTPAWINLPLVSTWRPFPNEQVPQYRKVGDIVYFRGTPEVNPGQTGDLAFATLPVGFRPPKNAYAITSGGSADAAGWVTWTVGMDGSVSHDGPKTAGSWLSLDNIQISVTP